MYTSSSFVSGCSSILNTFTCCSVKPLCNTTGGCPSGQYWCHLMESCLPVTSPCSPYHTSADGHIFTLPPRYTAMTPFYHMVADIALEIPPVSEPVHINVSRHAWQNTLFKAGVYSVTWNSSAETFIKAVMTILMSQWFNCICWHVYRHKTCYNNFYLIVLPLCQSYKYITACQTSKANSLYIRFRYKIHHSVITESSHYHKHLIITYWKYSLLWSLQCHSRTSELTKTRQLLPPGINLYKYLSRFLSAVMNSLCRCSVALWTQPWVKY